jgi:FkbM family methyltransferase
MKNLDFSKINYQSFLGRMVRLPLRLLPKGLVLPILQGKLRGKKWIVGAGEHGYWLGSYEIHKRMAFEQAVKPHQVIYDIGANVGFYSLLAAHLTGPQGKVYAFEPLNRNVEFIRQHADLNRFSNIEVFAVAVSDRGGEAYFDPGVSIATGHLSEIGSVKVSLVRLDDLLSAGDIMSPDIMKVDVEGAEHAVFQGAKKLVEAHRPIIFLDTHGRDVHDLTLKFLEGYGYQFTILDNRPLSAAKELIARPG